MESLHEEWRAVKGCEGQYEVSSHGRVRSLDREFVRRDGVRTKQTGKMLAPRPAKCGGYSRVGLTGGRDVYVHALVLEAFVGPRPVGHSCCHINGNPADNRLSNLRWGTQSDNEADKILHGRSNHGERGGGAKLTTTQVVEILKSQDRVVVLAQRFGVSYQTISRIRSGKTWRETTGTGALHR